MGKPREELWDFEETIYRHRPNDAGYYFLVRYGRNNQVIRAPETGTWRAREPFDEPIAPGGAWFVQYCKDSHGRERVHPVGKLGPLRVMLRWPSESDASAGGNAMDDAGTDPASADASATKASSDGDLVKLLTAGLEEDDAEGSVKGMRIAARKMEMAMQQKERIYELGKQQAFANEVVSCLKTNEFMRQQLRDQALINTQIQRESSAMLERSLALFEQVQLSAGRQNEREREASLRAASPPAPPDYTPVLTGVVKTIRDIGVAALQRDSRPLPPALDAGSAATATLGAARTQSSTSTPSIHPQSAAALSPPQDIAPDTLAALLAQASAGLAASEPDESPLLQTANPPARPSYEELQAQCEKLRADLAAAELRKTEPGPIAKPAARPATDCTPATASSAAAPIALPAASASSAAAPIAASPIATAPTPIATDVATAASIATTPPPGATAALTAAPPREAEISETKITAIASPPVTPVPIMQSVSSAIATPTQAPAEAKATPPAARQTNTQGASPSPRVDSREPTPATAQEEPQKTLSPEELKAFARSELVQGILVNVHAGHLFESDVPIPPLVEQAMQVEKVLLDPPNMDPETARRLLKDGSAIQSFGAFLFFNPMIRNALLKGRGK